ncbi:hypothetical protein ACIBG8_53735 [Nonomuraea sp. NPDC050556]|uniref:hypothetical protein n=1 Tax=Nonomuraea sp. NPDC050556 TaxID=3364369 RepID=UPI00378F7ED1
MIALLSLYVDMAIGLVMLFLLLSLLVSGVNEAAVRLLSVRSKFLWAYLRDTMDGAQEGARSWLPATVRGVFTVLPFLRDPRPKFDERPSPAEAKPMPAGTTAADDAMTKLFYERVREIDHGKTGKTSISNIPPGRFAGALMEMAAGEKDGVEGLLVKLKDLNSPLYGHLKGVWESAQRDMERFRQGVESWFDTEMQRLSMLYKRYVKWVVAVLGLVITLLFSMDGIEFTKTLLRDNAYRAAVSAIAGSAEGTESLKETCTPGVDPYKCVTDTLSSPAMVKVFDHAIISLRIPEDGDPSVSWNGGMWWQRVTTLSHWPGYLLTFVALLFGAPFWWDLFRRITGIRGRQ